MNDVPDNGPVDGLVLVSDLVIAHVEQLIEADRRMREREEAGCDGI
jgi:hypothetical protein